VDAYVRFADRVSWFVGRGVAWIILPLVFALSYEVFVRYVLYAPTTWAYDASYMLYGTLFMLAAPYALAVNSHVRGDILYRLWPAKVQAGLDLVLYILIFFPPVLAMLYLGWDYAYYSYSIGERSAMSPGGPIIWPLKMVIPLTALLLLVQGIAQVIRCARAIRRGSWD
jgi:TRAP-type mannitol/chloroaromatic compound transport system permease small subunit